MSGLRSWPVVDVDEYGYMTCPVLLCDAPLHLVRTYCIPLVAEQAAHDSHAPEVANTDRWQVECESGHVLHTCRDQIRHMNLRGGDEDETADSAPEYDHFVTHQLINALGGERL